MIKEFFQKKIRNSAVEAFKELGREINAEITYKLNTYKRKIIADFFSIIILSAALLFISVAIIFFMIEYLHLTKTISFGIIGILLLFTSLIIKITR